ncbi:MAG: dienelactone hydrolase family protein [Enterobacter hormaechei]
MKNAELPKQPVDIATDLNAPVLGLYGGQDTGIPLDTVETMRHALRAANAKAEIVGKEAGHAFNADYRPSYHAESAKDGRQRMLTWFSQYGGKKRKAKSPVAATPDRATFHQA